jgi:ABC-2 type transport system permease protein
MSSMGSRLGSAAWVLWVSAVLQWRSAVGLFSLVTTMVMPATFLVLTSRLAGDHGSEAATRLVVAVALMSLWASTVWGAGGILRRELRDGTFAAAVAGLHSPQLVLLGKTLGGTVYSVMVIAPTSAIMVVLLRMPIQVGDPFWLVLGMLVAVLSGTALGMLLACVVLLTRHGSQLSSALLYPVYLLGGLLVPPDALPAVLRPVSAVISLRWVTEFLVATAVGRVSFAPLAATVGLSALYFALGRLGFAKVLDLARKDGRLVL